MAVFNRYKR